MSDWRASPSLKVFTDRVHELNILAQAVADLQRGRSRPNRAPPGVPDRRLASKPDAPLPAR